MNIADTIRNMLNTAVSEEGMSLLHLAAANDDPEFIEVLLTRGAEINVQSKKGYTPLHVAVVQDNVKAMAILLNAGADLHATAEEGLTPLHIAAVEDNVKAMAILLNAGADLHATAKGGFTPLHIAASGDSVKGVEVLLNAGADLHATTEKGQRPLDFAENLEVAARLLSAGNMRVKTEDGWKPLDLDFETLKGSLKVIEIEVPVSAEAAKENDENYIEPEPDFDEAKQQRERYLAKPVSELELSVRASNCLERTNIKTIRELVRKEEKELLEYKYFGRASLNEIKEQLADIGLTLGMNLEGKADKET